VGLQLISWNVAGRVRSQPDQARALAAAQCDVVCLQEVTPTTLRAWRETLGELGMSGVWTSLDDWTPGERAPAGRRLGVLVAARERLEVLRTANPPWPERLLSVRFGAEPGIELHNLHSPISQKPDRVKLRTHRALHGYLRGALGRPQVLVGDLNTPRKELADGTTWSFARDSRGRLRLDRGQEWEDAELALLRGLEGHGFRDLYRELHRYGRKEVSWSYPRGRGGYRLDHLVASAQVRARTCEYLHEARLAGLSDHSPLYAELSSLTGGGTG
jgi:exonuclease III